MFRRPPSAANAPRRDSVPASYRPPARDTGAARFRGAWRRYVIGSRGLGGHGLRFLHLKSATGGQPPPRTNEEPYFLRRPRARMPAAPRPNRANVAAAATNKPCVALIDPLSFFLSARQHPFSGRTRMRPAVRRATLRSARGHFASPPAFGRQRSNRGRLPARAASPGDSPCALSGVAVPSPCDNARAALTLKAADRHPLATIAACSLSLLLLPASPQHRHRTQGQ